MKAKLFACLFVALIALLLVISCDPKATEPTETTYSTPTIKGTVSIPEGRSISPSEIYVKVIDEEGKTVSIPKAKSDGSFVVENLIAGMKYSILFTSVEPEFTNRGISRGNESTSGVGGWLQDIVPTMVGANDIGNVKLKPLGTIKGKAETDGNAEHYDTTVYIPGTSFIARTDKDGSFSIDNVPEGTYTLRYTHEGCIPVMKDDVFLSCPDGEENPEVAVGDVRLVSSFGTVEGIAKLGDSDDSSVVSIRLESEDNSIVYTSTSSREGNYVFNNVQPGTYRVIVSSTGYISQFSQYFTVSPATITQVSESITLFGNIGTVTGTVSLLDSDMKSGINILISDINGNNSFSTVTDGNGNFLKVVKLGTYTVTASYPGYVSVSYRIIVTENNTTDVSFTALLPDSGTITGFSSSPEEQVTVLYSDGTPLNTVLSGLDCSYRFERIPTGTYSVKFSKAGFASYIVTDVVVTPSTTTTVNGSPLVSSYGTISGTSSTSGETVSLLKEGVTIGSVITAEAKEYSFSNIEPGTYKVRFSKEGYTSKETDDISVSGGSSLTVNGTALVSLYGTISGKSYSEGESVYLVKDGNTVKSAVTLENREYKFEGVEPGEYKVRFSKNGYSSYESDKVNVDAGGFYVVDGAQLIGIYGAVAGNVVLPDADDFSGVVITLTNSTVMTDSLTEISSADGSFRFDNITVPGTYLLTYSKDGYVTDQSKSVNVVTGSVVVAESVTLRSISATVKGTVQLEGASSHENITILLRNDSNQYTATTDQKGEYLINRVVPGTYSVLASKDGFVTGQIPEFVIEPSADKQVDLLTLSIAIKSVTGSVELELATDYAGVLVTATNLNDNTAIYSAISNSSGNFTLAGMKSGEYSVVLSCNGYNTITLPTINVNDTTVYTLEKHKMIISKGQIAGLVKIEGYADYSGVRVSILGTDYSALTTKDGSFAFEVPSRNYPGGLRYEFDDYETASYTSTISVLTNSTYAVPDVEMKAINIPLVEGTVSVFGIAANHYENIQVYLEDLPSYIFTTDTDGKWKLEHVPLGRHTLAVERENARKVTRTINLVPAPSVKLDNIELIPDSATIYGNAYLTGMDDSSGITVRVTTPDGFDLSTVTDSNGYYYISNIVASKSHEVYFEKAGWDSASFSIPQGDLNPLDYIDMSASHPISLTDTTAPELTGMSVILGKGVETGREVNMYLFASDEGSGIRYIYTDMDSNFSNAERKPYYNPYTVIIPDELGEKTIYVKVEDGSGNVSSVKSSLVTIVNDKTELFGPLSDEKLHLTKENSPYLMTGNVLVEKGKTLIIDPGVEIQINGDYYFQVEGKLEAIGTESERIRIYGIDDGANNWYGIKFLADEPNRLSYIDISGLKNGIVGYCDIDHALITANGWAIGIRSYWDPDDCLWGSLTDSTVNGSVSVVCDDVKRNTIDGNTIYINESPFIGDNTIKGSTTIFSSTIDGNSFDGSRLETSYSFVYNNTVNSSTVYSHSDIQKYITYNGCTLYLGYHSSSSDDMVPSGLYNIEFNNCSFPRFASDVKDSNFINCGSITVESGRTTRESYICTGNYWGDINTVEIKSKGEGQNLSFITDYYDDFNKSRVDYSKYKEVAIENAGYHGQEPDGPYSGYSIGDTGPAGGLVFYDKGFYSDGWRYLEAAPADIGSYVFGFNRPDGTSNNRVGTAQVIGSGKYNTERLVEFMDIDGKAYSSASGTSTEEYAAKKCLDYTYGGYDDWFLPSMEELNLMYQNLQKKRLGSFANDYYWSSSEYHIFYNSVWCQSFYNGSQNNYYGRHFNYYVRAVRDF